MTNHANLDLRINRHDQPGQARVTARLELPGSPVSQEKSGVVRFDGDRLEELARIGEWESYGQLLADTLFGPAGVRALFAKARQATKGQVPLRLRLSIEPDAGRLRRFYWELLRDPEQPGSWLATDQTAPFSRYVTSGDERPVIRRSFEDLKALVVVANPLDLEDYFDEQQQQLPPIDLPGEVARARQALGTIAVTLLCSDPGLEPDGPPTLNEILAHLGHDYDILYLVAHGILDGDNPQLWLEDPDRQAAVVFGNDTSGPFGETVPGLLTRLGKLPVLPRLVILASCESASPGQGRAGSSEGQHREEPASRDTWAWAALGPRLAEIGVPAVIAMQGKVTMRTVEEFMPTLFAGLRLDGQIDRAVAAARLAVQDRWDWWLPVLFSRLRDGLLFTAPREAPGPAAVTPAPLGGFATAQQREMLQQELAQHRRNLARLRAQKAVFAAGEEPLRLLNQIDHEQVEIQRLEAELQSRPAG